MGNMSVRSWPFSLCAPNIGFSASLHWVSGTGAPHCWPESGNKNLQGCVLVIAPHDQKLGCAFYFKTWESSKQFCKRHELKTEEHITVREASARLTPFLIHVRQDSGTWDQLGTSPLLNPFLDSCRWHQPGCHHLLGCSIRKWFRFWEAEGGFSALLEDSVRKTRGSPHP